MFECRNLSVLALREKENFNVLMTDIRQARERLGAIIILLEIV